MLQLAMGLMHNLRQRFFFAILCVGLFLNVGCDPDPPNGGSNKPKEDAITVGEPDTFMTQRMQLTWANRGPNYVYPDDTMRFYLPPDLIGVIFTLNDPGNSPIVYESLFNDKVTSAAYEPSKGDPEPLSRASTMWPDVVSIGFPSNAKTVPINGSYVELDLASMGAAIGDNADLYITSLRRSSLELGDHIDIQARVLNDAISPNELAQLDEAVKDIYLNACSGLSHCLTPHILDDYIALTLPEEDFNGVLMVAEKASPADEPTLYDELAAYEMAGMERGINVVFVSELGANFLQQGQVLLGISGGIPSPPFDGTRASSLFIAVDNHRHGNTLDIPFLATTIAHEMGHMMGLFHTTEARGLEFDPIADTLECHAPPGQKAACAKCDDPKTENDEDCDKCIFMNASKCRDLDASNIMFWEGDIPVCAVDSAGCAYLSAEQVMVLRSHPLAYRDR